MSAQQKPQPQNALQGFSQNRDQPVKIQAASLEVRDKDKVAMFTGDVHLLQGDTEMRCKSLTVHYDEDSAGKKPEGGRSRPGRSAANQRIEAKGGVTVVQKDQNARGERHLRHAREYRHPDRQRHRDPRRGRGAGPRLAVDLTSGTSKISGAEALFRRGGAMGPEKALGGEKK